MEVMDGHNRSLECLGAEHLWEALFDPCHECPIMPLTMRQARLAVMERLSDDFVFFLDIPVSQYKRK